MEVLIKREALDVLAVGYLYCKEAVVVVVGVVF